MRVHRIALLLAPIVVFGQEQPCDMFTGHNRWALVIGNGNYDKLPPAANAAANSKAIADALQSAGFTVTLVTDGTMPAMFEDDQKQFLKRVQPGDVVFFYYSGHIVQGSNGEDFMLPRGFDPSQDVSGELAAFSLNRFLGDLYDGHKPGLTMVMIEGPFPFPQTIAGQAGTGLVVPALQGNTLFAMASEAGTLVASQQDAGISRFTAALIQQLSNPGLHPSQVFLAARQKVINDTARAQVPAIEDLQSPFCFEKPPEKLKPLSTNRTDREEYVLIPHGVFEMGCVPTDTKCQADEKPQHRVTLTKDFYLGRNEVQVSSFQRFWKDTKQRDKDFPKAPLNDYDHWKIGDLPMVNVTWDDAAGYCKWAGGRLPTEAEWEYSARAGASEEIEPGNRADSREKANFSGQKGNDTYLGVAPVKKFDPNAFGVYDMLGNVQEYVSDWFGPYSAMPQVDPMGPPSGDDRVARGGSFESVPEDHLRLSFRLKISKKNRDFKTGFRCVLEVTPEVRKALGLPSAAEHE